MSPDELLARMAGTLRHDIGPAVADEYAKTQAFMAAVVLDKLSRQLAATVDHELADRADRDALFGDLPAVLPEHGTPTIVREAVADAANTKADAELCRLIQVLYEARDELGPDRFDTALTRIRQVLRARIDRRMEVAR
jgi:hypothetical protein